MINSPLNDLNVGLKWKTVDLLLDLCLKPFLHKMEDFDGLEEFCGNRQNYKVEGKGADGMG